LGWFGVDGYYTYYLNHPNHLVGGKHLYVSAIAKSEDFEASYNSITLAYQGELLGRNEIINIVEQLRGF
jgi:hypothetical protein